MEIELFQTGSDMRNKPVYYTNAQYFHPRNWWINVYGA
jgi:hypothetical protein